MLQTTVAPWSFDPSLWWSSCSVVACKIIIIQRLSFFTVWDILQCNGLILLSLCYLKQICKQVFFCFFLRMQYVEFFSHRHVSTCAMILTFYVLPIQKKDAFRILFLSVVHWIWQVNHSKFAKCHVNKIVSYIMSLKYLGSISPTHSTNF